MSLIPLFLGVRKAHRVCVMVAFLLGTGGLSRSPSMRFGYLGTLKWLTGWDLQRSASAWQVPLPFSGDVGLGWPHTTAHPPVWQQGWTSGASCWHPCSLIMSSLNVQAGWQYSFKNKALRMSSCPRSCLLPVSL